MPTLNEYGTAPMPYFKAVYYSNFWYSRHYRPGAVDFGGNVIQNDIEKHTRELRIFSIFFDELYIPRTHLITEAFADQYQIAHAILQSREFSYLYEHGAIRVSSFPGLDAYEDNERIVSRAGLTDAVTYPQDPDFLKRIPIDKTISVNSLNESKSNTATFPAYADSIRNRNPILAQQYLDILKEATIRDIPFFHESFVRMLRDRLPSEHFDPIWRTTNSIYLSQGAPEHGAIIPCFNEEIESLDFRFSKFGADRVLYSFSSLYSFLGLLLGEEIVSDLLYRDIGETHALIYEGGQSELIRSFRLEYQRLVADLSRFTRRPPVCFELDQRAIRSLFELYMDGAFRRGSAVATDILRDLNSLSKGVDATAGIVTELVRAAAKHGSGFMRDRMRRRRFPHITRMMDALRQSVESRRR